MKNLFSDILKAKIFAHAGKGLLLRFPSKKFFFLLLASFVNPNSTNGRFVSLQMVMVNGALNNQRNQQFNQQQQIRMT